MGRMSRGLYLYIGDTYSLSIRVQLALSLLIKEEDWLVTQAVPKIFAKAIRSFES